MTHLHPKPDPPRHSATLKRNEKRGRGPVLRMFFHANYTQYAADLQQPVPPQLAVVHIYPILVVPGTAHS